MAGYCLERIRMGSWVWLFLMAVFCLLGCSNSQMDVPDEDLFSSAPRDSLASSSSEGAPPENSSNLFADFKKIEARNKFAYVGTNDLAAKASERPQMKVKFSYDFFMGKSEVICGEFNKTMEGLLKFKAACPSDLFPATDVTFFDAILFANAKSKLLKKDTAYTYSVATFDNEGHCSNLEGLVFLPGADAFRLPTEAEWIYAAQTSWNPVESWNSENSGNVAHEVCLSEKNAVLCDMAGNVMEWVFDWLGNFRDTTVSNFLGASEANGLAERVLKGGGFRTQPTGMNVYSRGDVYAVTSSTHADYVGFRLACGAIPKPTWLNNKGKTVDAKITSLVNSSMMRQMTGAFKVKLAFRNDVSGNLAYIDYSDKSSVVEIEDNIDSYHPDISPDGKWVAFCTGVEGSPAKSSVYVRRLDPTGSGLTKLNVENAVIPRWRVLENGDTAIVYVTSAANNTDEMAFFKESTWQVKFSKGTFGEPQKLFDGAYHGGVSPDNRLAVTGSKKFRARKVSSVDSNDVRYDVWYDGEQTCNVSMARDGSKRTVALDFAPKASRDAFKYDYVPHEIAFVVDSNGIMKLVVVAPKPYTYDHTEWVYDESSRENGGIVVATLVNAEGAHTKIAIIDFMAKSTVEIVQGDELWHPALWANTAENITYGTVDKDSAGAYCTPGCGINPLLMRYKMELLWTYKDEANTVLLGSSRMLHGAIPAQFNEKFNVLNMANVPNMVYVSKYLFKNYIVPHVKNLKYLVLSLDIDLWYHGEESDYNFFYKDYKNHIGYIYDENHSYWKDGCPEGLAEMTQISYGLGNYAKMYTGEMGYARLDGNSWGQQVFFGYDSTWMDREPEHFYESFNSLKEIIEFAAERNIYVVGVVFPQNPLFKFTGSFGRYGMRRSEAPALLNEIAQLSETYPNFIFMDENKMGDHDYADHMAYDEDHLAYPGAVQMTARIDSVLKTLK
mgnify:CR=1 FL=1